ncbi:MAG: biotin--[acetyl-CoA-carboxylase] ligase [Lachnospira sp.]|nr:biotin--[acetyl-CoA-carboxylase] ligase [Lachnospira sp.]
MKTSILRMIRQSSGYVSGQSLCEALGVSRTAVWKYVNQLKEEGYEFDAVSNKGYRIVKYPDIITREEIESMLPEGLAVTNVVYYHETDSTNTRAKQAAEDGEKSGTLFITECQTGGRGRRGRTWESPAGSGIWMSLLLRPEIKPFDASMLTIVAAMGMKDAIEEIIGGGTGQGGIHCKIKWPNDIVLGDRKICGMLTEMSAETDWINYVVIGIGVNVNTTEFDDSIKDTASSILLQTGSSVKRSDVVVAFARHFSRYYDEFLKECNLSGLADDYNKALINVGRDVKIVERDGSFVAKAVGIDETGSLIVEKDGDTKRIVAGEVSVRGLYGYV